MSVKPSQTPSSGRLGAGRAISLVARREITTRAATKSFIITNIILLVVIIAGIIVLSIFTGNDKATKVGLVGDNPEMSQTIVAVGDASGEKIEIVPIADAEEARTQAEKGDVEVALVPTGSGNSYDAITKDDLDGTLEGVLRTSVSQDGLSKALAAENVDLAAITADSTLNVTETEPAKPNEGQRIAIALTGVSLLMFAVLQGGSMVAAGVVEEKTSRVVELLLATIKPLHLLWGKILGIGLMAFAQVVLLGGTALITALATGLLDVPSTAGSMFAAVIVWFILGFLFFATLYAATGAVVSRQEELGSSSAPLTILAMAVIYAAIFGINALDSTLMQTLAWIPPFSASIMPMRIATGDASIFQVIATIVLMIIACAIATWLAARIYQRNILRTGARVKWMEAIKG
ncbi:ABC transporter permease [Williamsia sp. 1135]|uniref:ABC transporter permease n=1 Tax=Williamsia sp. 1135 TaxID=1889262 RepID=UPI000A111F16|nr:ABC transporter permease [Williamsia sp. 1135]ORM32566.1 sodium ABC transporter permease [Williamsia sp. 1135]